MSLKTLNDLKFHTSILEDDETVSRCRIVDGNELKKEIVTEARKYLKQCNKHGEDECWITPNETISTIEEFIRHFFNIEK